MHSNLFKSWTNLGQIVHHLIKIQEIFNLYAHSEQLSVNYFSQLLFLRLEQMHSYCLSLLATDEVTCKIIA